MHHGSHPDTDMRWELEECVWQIELQRLFNENEWIFIFSPETASSQPLGARLPLPMTKGIGTPEPS